MKLIILLFLLISINCFSQNLMQVSYRDSNGRMDKWMVVPEPKKDTIALIRDTIYMDSLNWPNKEGKITRETVYVDPRTLRKAERVISGQPMWLGSGGTLTSITASNSRLIIHHKKGKKKKHYRKITKTHYKTSYEKGEDEYYDLYFSGYGRVVDRWGSYVTIAESKGKFYHKKQSK